MKAAQPFACNLPRPSCQTRGARGLGVPALILIAAVCFNAFLAVINAHLFRLTDSIVIAVEVILLLAAHLAALKRYHQDMAAWYLLLGLLIVWCLVRAFATGFIEPKLVRDVAIIPTFILLGMISDPKQLDRTVLIILAIAGAAGAMEAIFPDWYSSAFDIKNYYIQTRNYTNEDFFNKDSTLFVSATRSDGRMFAFLDMPRLSSIFLEPVSLENYCTIMTAYFCTRFRELSAPALSLGMLTVVFLLIGSDGRLATASAALVVAVCVFAPYVPSFCAALYLPLILIAGLGVTLIMHPDPNSDDFPGRIAYTTDMLQNFTLVDLLGLSDRLLQAAVDSGVAYLIITQSLIGTVVLFLFVIYASAQNTKEQMRFMHALLLYTSLTMMVSASMLTIKTAALAWFIHGALQRSSARAPQRWHLKGRTPRQSFLQYRKLTNLASGVRPV
jgi:putative polymerase